MRFDQITATNQIVTGIFFNGFLDVLARLVTRCRHRYSFLWFSIDVKHVITSADIILVL
ncbi:hypothetical protein HanIR_Chr17g0861761 [Helianthus annuus]|nr:hypothetical protein HanIR_Chr17g0861761 [Helianthus annuus]